MKKNLTEVAFILDKSGSMVGLEKSTIDGYNQFLESQRKTDGDVTVSTILFNHEYHILHDRVSIKDVKPLTEADYQADGWTALYDSMGRTIDHIGKVLSETKEEERPSKVIIVTITDGMENSSVDYSHPMIKKMIEHQKNVYDWTFIFLGANFDAEAFAESISIDKLYAANYDYSEEGITASYQTMCEMVMDIREDKVIDENWKDALEGKKNKDLD